MKIKITLLPIALAAVLCFSGCVFALGSVIDGSGALVTKNFELTDFSGVQLSHSCKARITRGSQYRVEVTVDDNIREFLVVRKEGAVLEISLRPEHRYGRITFKADITVPDLETIGLSGASSARLYGFDTDRPLFGRLSGASRLYGSINTGDAEFKLSGASHLTLQGRGGALGIRASGASSVDLGRFGARDVRLDLSGASRVTVNAAGRLDAETSGASIVQYFGNPTLGHLSTSGASSIESLE